MLTLLVAATLAFPQTVPAATTVPAAKIVPTQNAPGAKPAAVEPQEPTMFPGSPAPFPDISNFIKGDSVTAFEPGKVYVMEFWATWCGPCLTGMPHLSEIQAKYADKGLRIIGISNEKLETVSNFLAKPEWAAKTQYTLCTDPDKSAHAQYMGAAMQNGIPTAFIVKDSVVQWIGHPMSMDEPMAAIVGGSWNVAKAKESFLGPGQATKVQRRMSALLREASKTGDYAAFLVMLDEAIAKADPNEAMSMELQKFKILLGAANQPDAAYALGNKLVAHMTTQKFAMGLNEIAWFVLDAPTVKSRDYAFALKTANAAATLSDNKDGPILDTLARAYWETNDAKQAVETQKLAIANTPEGQMLDEMKETLKKYEQGAPAKKG